MNTVFHTFSLYASAEGDRNGPGSENPDAGLFVCFSSDPTACRADFSESYQEQQKLSLEVLVSINGKSRDEPAKMVQKMRLKNPTLFK